MPGIIKSIEDAIRAVDALLGSWAGAIRQPWKDAAVAALLAGDYPTARALLTNGVVEAQQAAGPVPEPATK